METRRVGANQEQRRPLDDGEIQNQPPLAQSTDSDADERNDSVEALGHLQSLLELLINGEEGGPDQGDDGGSRRESNEEEQQDSRQDGNGRAYCDDTC